MQCYERGVSCSVTPSSGLTLIASSSSFAKLLPLKSKLGLLSLCFLSAPCKLQDFRMLLLHNVTQYSQHDPVAIAKGGSKAE